MQAALAAGHPDVSGEGLEAQYFMRGAVPEWRQYLKLWETDSAATRMMLPGTLNIQYGTSGDETLDVLLPATSVNDAPVQILLHGGYWRALHKDDFSFLAPPLAAAGIVSVVVNYALCPAVTMSELTEQCRRAVRWTRAHIAAFGGDPKNLHLTGHSAGAHLAVMMALTPDLAGAIRSVTALSGLYDLAPVSLCSMQQDLRLTPAEIAALSPMDQALPSGLKLLVGAGAEETAAFHWQSDAFGAVCRANGLDCMVMNIPHHHHYSVVGALCEDGPLRTAWLEMCGT
jgi:arylformamidase